MLAETGVSKQYLAYDLRYILGHVLARGGPRCGLRDGKLNRPDDCRRVGSAKDVAAAFKCFRPFRHISKRYVRDTENRTFLLDGSAVRHYGK